MTCARRDCVWLILSEQRPYFCDQHPRFGSHWFWESHMCRLTNKYTLIHKYNDIIVISLSVTLKDIIQIKVVIHVCNSPIHESYLAQGYISRAIWHGGLDWVHKRYAGNGLGIFHWNGSLHTTSVGQVPAFATCWDNADDVIDFNQLFKWRRSVVSDIIEMFGFWIKGLSRNDHWPLPVLRLSCDYCV